MVFADLNSVQQEQSNLSDDYELMTKLKETFMLESHNLRIRTQTKKLMLD